MRRAVERGGGSLPQSCQIPCLLSLPGCRSLRFTLSLSPPLLSATTPTKGGCQNEPAQLSPGWADTMLHRWRPSSRNCPLRRHARLASQATLEAATKPKGKRQNIATSPVLKRRRGKELQLGGKAASKPGGVSQGTDLLGRYLQLAFGHDPPTPRTLPLVPRYAARREAALLKASRSDA